MKTQLKTQTQRTRTGILIALVLPLLSAPDWLPAAQAQNEKSEAAPLQNEKNEIDAKGQKLAEDFLRALQKPEAERLKSALPFLHRSQLTADGKDIDPSVKIAWKKAIANADAYLLPVKVTRVRPKGNLTIGEGSDSVERGRVDDYFLAKKPDSGGLPGSVTIFFPENGEPKIYYMGGL